MQILIRKKTHILITYCSQVQNLFGSVNQFRKNVRKLKRHLILSSSPAMFRKSKLDLLNFKTDKSDLGFSTVVLLSLHPNLILRSDFIRSSIWWVVYCSKFTTFISKLLKYYYRIFVIWKKGIIWKAWKELLDSQWPLNLLNMN